MSNNTSNLSLSEAESHFVCPECRQKFVAENGELHCSACDRSYSFSDGLFMFTVQESEHGEIPVEEMKQIIASAKSKGWRETLNDIEPAQSARVRNLITNPLRKNSIELLNGVGGKVLDFGCGYGGVSIALADTFDEVVSLDGSLERVSFLNVMRQQEGKTNITPLCHMDVLNLPFDDNYFDAFTLIGVLEYLPQTLPEIEFTLAQQRCLESFCRVLKPGGKILIHTKNRFGWQYLRGARDHTGLRFAPALPRFLADLLLRLKGGGPYRIINHSLGGYTKLLKSAGFSDLEFYWPYPGYQMPEGFVNLSPVTLEHGEALGISKTKMLIYKCLAKIGLLRYVVPNFTIVATKER